MKFNTCHTLSLLSLVSGGLARPRHSSDRDEPISQKSHVTAFVNTDNGLKVECWSVEDLLHDKPGHNHHRMSLMSRSLEDAFTITFEPGATIFRGDRENSNRRGTYDGFKDRANLITVKEGVVLIDAYPEHRRQNDNDDEEDRRMPSQYVFTGLNGDDWFYYEDKTNKGNGEGCCHKTEREGDIIARTYSGQDTTMIAFQYDKTPNHKVVHEGRCRFAGLQPTHGQRSHRDRNSDRLYVQPLDL